MNLEYFIARRSERESKSQEPSIMMRVATVAVALGVVVMIITIAVIGGFKSQINAKLSGLSGHVVVTHTRGVQPSQGLYIEDSPSLDQIICDEPSLTRQSSYILRGAIARAGGVIEGVVVKGVDSLYNTPFFERHITSGELPQFGTGRSRREVLISKSLADDMTLDVGQRLELLFGDESGGEISRLTFKVAGIFASGIGEIEKRVIVADIETLRGVNGWGPSQISGREIWINEINNGDEIAENINKKITFDTDSKLEQIRALSLQEIYPSLFDWLNTHNINGVVVISIMMIVALFNMVTALLILVLERTQMIGVLKALGMTNESLRKIFLYRSMSVIFRGLAWGNAIALVLCGVQSRWGVLKLEASGYMLSEVPIELGVGWIVGLNLGVVVVVLAVMTIPTRIVATIKPDEIMKYK
ncbi:MAG: FtsX-like permease family protein [Rikenellaceae bacterium]